MNDVYKLNLLRLVRDHKEHCPGETCNVSVSLILVVAIRAGLEFTDEERREFV